MNNDFVKSYLQARDPSIMAYNRTNLDNVKINLADLMKNNSTEVEEKTEENQFITVYLRIRGDVQMSEMYKIEGNNFICKVPTEGSYSLRNIKFGDTMNRTYTFSKIFGPEFDQKKIFEYTVKQKLLSFINGRNSTLFTYGASGSGKTHTIVGTPEEPGLIPRALEYVFKSLPSINLKPEVKPLPNGSTQFMTEEMLIANEKYKNFIVNATLCDQTAHISTYKQMQNRLSSESIAEVTIDSGVSVSAWISFTEIYNENIYDLLSLNDSKNKRRSRLALGISMEENKYIKKLTYLHVTNGLEAYQILQYGLHNLNYAATAINSHSSRSHCIFTIRLVQSSKNSKNVYISNFNFCDLAGSERLKKTMNFGDRLRETNNINTSLLVLGRCMENIRKCQQVKDKRLIPFRESKLTQIFQKALLGYENVEMIVNVNLCRDMLDETIHVLNFSAIAKTIVVEEELPKPARKENRFSLMMKNEDNSKVTKTTINERQKNFGTNQEEFYKLQKENRRLKSENQRLKLELQQNCNDPSDEIRSLNDAIDMIIQERDNIIEIYEKKIIEEKESVIAHYKESIAQYIQMYQESKEIALKRQREEYEEKLAELQVITISSDDEESPKKYNSRRINELEAKLSQCEKHKEELTNLLEDGKEEYRSLQLEINRLYEENKTFKSVIVELKEELESLQVLSQSTKCFHEDLSDTEDSESQESTQND